MIRNLYVLLSLILVFFLAGCADVDNPALSARECSDDSECELPFDYAIQSNCPFESLCIDSECRVACLLFYNDPETEGTQYFACDSDEDCDCSLRGDATLECLCHGERCVSVED